MKYLEVPDLDHLSEVLSFSSLECRVHTRFGSSQFPLGCPISSPAAATLPPHLPAKNSYTVELD
jgi:hypothetical protein